MSQFTIFAALVRHLRERAPSSQSTTAVQRYQAWCSEALFAGSNVRRVHLMSAEQLPDSTRSAVDFIHSPRLNRPR